MENTQSGFVPSVGPEVPEDEQKVRKSKKELTKADKTVAWILLILNTLLIFAIPFLGATSEVDPGFIFITLISFLGAFTFGFVVSLVGIFVGYILTFRRKSTTLAVFLLIVSFLAFPPIAPSFLINQTLVYDSFITIGENWEDNNQDRESKRYRNKRLKIYDELVAELNSPQGVLGVEDQGSYFYIVTRAGHIIQPSGIHGNLQAQPILSWANENLIGNSVKITMPPFEEVKGSLMRCEEAPNNFLINMRRKYGLDDFASGVCDVVYADVYFNGKNLTDYGPQF